MPTPTIQLLVNSEDYLFQKHLKRLLADLVLPEDRDFNFERLSVKGLAADQMLDRFRTPPMMGASRTVVLDQFELCKKDVLERLEPYFKNPEPTTNVILIASKIDGRLKFFKTFKEHGTVVEFKTLYDNKLAEFIVYEAKDRGLIIDLRAAQDLSDAVGNHLMSLVSELEKLALYVHPRNTITQADVGQVVAEGLVHNVFRITNLIGQKNLYESLNLARRMVEQGEPIIRLVALIIGHFRKLLLVSDSRGLASNELAKVIGVPPFFLKDYEQQAKRFGSESLKLIFKKLMVFSIGLRSSGAGPETLLEGFLQDLCLNS